MKLITYTWAGKEQVALLERSYVYHLPDMDSRLPSTMTGLLADWDRAMPLVAEIQRQLRLEEKAAVKGMALQAATIKAPVTHPPSVRDGYAFRQHVAAARRGRGVPMIEAFDRYPVFYFTNPRSIKGPGPVVCLPDHLEDLDFELEVAVVISRRGSNIRAEEAKDYIAGYMIMNDFSARRLQREEMLLNLGPAKGKDFATATGPWLVTPDELSGFEVPAKDKHRGTNLSLNMCCRVNGREVSRGNLADMDWTFAELIERASYGTELVPGDIIGSGTVGTGCFLELNGTARLDNPKHKDQWLQPGDLVELEVEGLGVLSNTIARADSEHSLFKLRL